VAKTIRILYKQQYYIQYDFGAVQTVWYVFSPRFILGNVVFKV
jgi:hypothetical protein